MRFLFYSVFIVLSAGLFSCASYKKNIMFKPEMAVPAKLQRDVIDVEKNYTIQKNDYLKVDVFTNKGERLIDPNPDLTQPLTTTTQSTVVRKDFNYLVDLSGVVKLPMIGELHVEGLTLRQAEEIMQKEYNNYFKEAFVVLTYANKRVIVLGAVPGQVIPLTNLNIHLAEVLAMAKGVDNNANAKNIRVIRGETFYLVDFSTIDGFTKGNLLIEPGDIIYVEPIRRPFSEGLKDNTGLVSLVVSLTSLIIIINSVK